MSKVTVTYTVTYDLKGKLREEYLDQLEGYKDSKARRKWFAIDRFIGHHNLELFDKKAKLTVTEEQN
ncbi:hypothetical protein UFOVP115_95 [uncultured Caudovirales phage]|uniref:Uncharacterized protein n=1 Tax=uncultured Caudovirales phage TaxID=2100421 RepID=A0A6J5L5R6_9CAUD|nr:hypothetical protein UFOVP115_95 [uncultured Caudovirales phage]